MKVLLVALLALGVGGSAAFADCPYDPDCINNPFGAGNPFSNEKFYVVPSD